MPFKFATIIFLTPSQNMSSKKPIQLMNTKKVNRASFYIVKMWSFYMTRPTAQKFDTCTQKYISLYCLSNLSSALVLFANPAIYASSSLLTCKDSFLFVLMIANSTPKIIYNQIISLKLPSSLLKELCSRTAQAHKITLTDSNFQKIVL